MCTLYLPTNPLPNYLKEEKVAFETPLSFRNGMLHSMKKNLKIAGEQSAKLVQ